MHSVQVVDRILQKSIVKFIPTRKFSVYISSTLCFCRFVSHFFLFFIIAFDFDCMCVVYARKNIQFENMIYKYSQRDEKDLEYAVSAYLINFA